MSLIFGRVITRRSNKKEINSFFGLFKVALAPNDFTKIHSYNHSNFVSEKSTLKTEKSHSPTLDQPMTQERF